MAVSMADITKLRKMTGAGMMDCKNALTEAEGDFDKAMEIIRKKGQAVAAKRSDREASEGCVLAKTTGDFAVIIALKCETDFVAQNADFVKLTQDILDLAVANKCKTLDEVKALPMGNGTVQDAVTDRSGITGEKMELDGYMTVEGASTVVYNHMNRNGLCTIVAFNKAVEEGLAKQIAMQIAAMNPIAVDEDGVSEEITHQKCNLPAGFALSEGQRVAFEKALSAHSAKLSYCSLPTEKEHCKIAVVPNLCNVATLKVARFFFFGKFPIPSAAFFYRLDAERLFRLVKHSF